ncbi:GAF domain-containing sensor histidine kinase [Limnothrix sp. FACHB-881]|uniref:ATP-binding protein n=1 Tax=Limnothrix sp. FACHB-881 TaxID=2692819 RepID=UPI0016837F04|nr:ATP-binding protein [Limnothrix sp. FACHB-881]MBD2637051.1 GAF domain-containing sensor histidine kinase [Limnothrix sp. FACHB-881]
MVTQLPSYAMRRSPHRSQAGPLLVHSLGTSAARLRNSSSWSDGAIESTNHSANQPVANSASLNQELAFSADPDSTAHWLDSSSEADCRSLLTMLNGVGAILTGTGPLERRLQRTLRYLARYLDLKEAELWSYDRVQHRFKLAALFVRGQGRNLAVHFDRSVSEAEVRKLGRRGSRSMGKLELSQLSPQGLETGSEEAASSAQAFYWGAYPLRMERHPLGMLLLWRDRPWSLAMQEAVEQVARLVALALGHDLAKQGDRQKPEVRLRPWLEKIRSSLDLDAILAAAVRELRLVLRVDRCAYLWALRGPNGAMQLTVSHQDSRQPALDGAFTRAIAQGLPSLLMPAALDRADLSTTSTLPWTQLTHLLHHPDPQVAHWAESAGINALLIVPVQTASGHSGAIACTTTSQRRQWSSDDCEALRWAADRLAVAISQAELYDRSQAAVRATETQFHELERTLEDLKKAQAQLVHSEKMSSLGQLAAGIAHEINNPVNFISGNLDWASDALTELIELVRLYQRHTYDHDPEIMAQAEQMDLEFVLEDLPKVLHSMRQGTERIQGIVASMRNFSRLDRAEVSSVDLHEGIDSTLLILHSRLERKGRQNRIEVVRDYGELPLVECHSGQLNQVFMNLLSNAIDALEDRETDPRIVIRTQLMAANPAVDGSAQPSKPGVEITIQDNGSGIPSEVTSRIFDPFFTTKPVGKGTGLGLSISYQIVVDRHGGKIACESQPHKGTTFRLWLPLAVTDRNH